MALWLRLVGRLQPSKTIPHAMAGLSDVQRILVGARKYSVTPETRGT
jgi:hypothetical protein